MNNKVSELSMLEAINETLHSEMARDERVVVLGEDVGRNGGGFRATEGLIEKVGESRVVDTTIFSVYGNKIFFLIILLYIFLVFSFNRIKNE